MLHEFVAGNREEILSRCRARVAGRPVPPPTLGGLEPGIPLFLDQLVDALRAPDILTSEIGSSAKRHGRNLQRQGFSVSQVVYDYGDVCQSITELALETGSTISVDDFRTLNRCLDDAIASAVTGYGREESEPGLEGESRRDGQRVAFLAHELRNGINTALVAFEVLRTGNVGVSGSTGSVLRRSLLGLRELIGRSVAEVRLAQDLQNQVPMLVSEFINDVAPTAALQADRRRIALTVRPVEEGVAIHADREILSAVVGNLLQNAIKFTRPGTTVTLSAHATHERVLIEVADECGGLPGGNGAGLFRPFEQRSADRTGLGLGLSFCRWGVEASQGRLDVRSVAEHGCVFTVDLPRFVGQPPKPSHLAHLPGTQGADASGQGLASRVSQETARQ